MPHMKSQNPSNHNCAAFAPEHVDECSSSKTAAHTFTSRLARIKGPSAFPPTLPLPSLFDYGRLARVREAIKLRRLEIVALSTARGGYKPIGETVSLRPANRLRADGQPALVAGITVDRDVVDVAPGRTEP